MKKFLIPLLALFLLAGCKSDSPDPGTEPPPGPVDPPVEPVDPDPDPDPDPEPQTADYPAAAWTATYGNGQSFAFESKYPEARANKFVGMFYFIWLGAHGYDNGENYNDVQRPKSTDVNSPYDINLLLQQNPTNPQYGPQHAFHHWGKPYLDYYVSNDRWVIRKHAQMLSDAGVDVIFFDVTNGYHYLPIVNVICEEYMKLRKDGNNTPQIAFLVNAQPQNVVRTLYNDFYIGKPQYSDLWFYWNDKPLLLCPSDVTYDININYFTTRHSWFDTNGDWFKNANGYNKWPWGDYYKQKAGNSSTSSNEAMSVMPATHPTSSIGRSYNGSTQPVDPSTDVSAQGTYFKLQFEHALQTDPNLIFITGWNEWVAQRFINEGQQNTFIGKNLPVGGSFFVDQYNHEFSRDIEPVDGGFGDIYYYYMVDYIRRFKGVKQAEPVAETNEIIIDGDMSDWNAVNAIYTDDKGDVSARSNHGYGLRTGTLINYTGRNDIVKTKVAVDESNVYFYVETADDLTPHTDSKWMRLFIDVVGSNTPKWEGFSYVINNSIANEETTNLEKCSGGWAWGEPVSVSYKVSGSKMEISVPLASLGITNSNDFSIDFKWVDNAISNGDIMECMRDGDSAPNGRFRYRYSFKK